MKKLFAAVIAIAMLFSFAAMAETPCPENVVYVPGAESLESCASAKDIAYTLYGGMPVQIGYCNGYNKSTTI